MTSAGRATPALAWEAADVSAPFAQYLPYRSGQPVAAVEGSNVISNSEGQSSLLPPRHMGLVGDHRNSSV